MEAAAGFISRAGRGIENPILEQGGSARELERQGGKLIMINIGDPGIYFRMPRNIAWAFKKAVDEGHTNYLREQGLEELREAVSDRYKGLYGIEFSGDDVVITQGVSEALSFMNQAMIDPGDAAVIFRPFFTEYLTYLKLSGGVAILPPLDEKRGWDISIGELDDALRSHAGKRPKYMLITNPNNPTGTVLSEKAIREAIEIAKDNDMFVVSDEVYDELLYNGAAFTSVGKLAKGIPHLLLNGASKNYMSTGLRIGFAIFPEQDTKTQALKRTFIGMAGARLSANTPSQYAMLEGLRNTAKHQEFIREKAAQIASQSVHAARLVNETGFLTTVQPNSAFYLFARIHLDKLSLRDDREFVELLLREQKVQLTRGSGFGMPGFIRIVTLPSEAVLTEAIRRIKRFCEDHQR
ncbi:MAG: aminotransferase class I/II-fold pyridoxal phosphate-dependent enzyme [Candidatus Marsarchaeota archaeon]|nr:aminotransferase class I/II-fold pyridoxal phosphate-dependent enzyme [Candidatus Marsarchaeota archaeon]